MDVQVICVLLLCAKDFFLFWAMNFEATEEMIKESFLDWKLG